ncbi:hypothetical protein BKA66DRAFT_567464 [Pyrenochaeta sp. MPI-SDFR-AT-0127]|nr:hypothetical protein BKA66DRAFT_567464 [Pyrenochaeta sp. MPI-SDFR-AT-0127]
MAQVTDSGVTAAYTGFWFDHDNGRFLTLTNRNAATLLSFLAISVTFASNRSWKILRFALYQFLCTRPEKPGRLPSRTRELQVILRNVVTAGSTLWTCIELLWTRRRTAKETPQSETAKRSINSGSIPLALIAVVHFIAFIAAGILTSRILVGQTVVSRVTPTCGQWQARDIGGTLEQTLTDQSLRLNETQDADNLVRNCYSLGVSRGILDCGKLYTRSLPYHLESNAPCPFGDDLCSTRPEGAFVLDSGPISFRDLGINSKFAKSLSVQRRSICAVVPDEPFLDQRYLGQDGTEVARSYAFIIKEDVAGFFYSEIVSGTYNLQAYHLVFEPEQIPLPIRPTQPDHEPSVIFLRSNGVRFTSKSDDPWFSVHTQVPGNSSNVVYHTDHFLNVIACKEAVRFCSDTSSTCSSWKGLISALKGADTMFSTLAGPKIQKNTSDYEEISAVYSLVALATRLTSIPDSIQNRPATSALQAARYLETIVQFHLEPEQWKIELEYWFAMSMARLQLGIFNTIEKPPGVNVSQAINQWEGTSLKGLCGRVKFHSASHTTLSTMGIIVVLVVVIFLTLASSLDVILGWLPFAWARKLATDWENLENLKLLEELEGWWKEIGQASDPLQVHTETTK